ncbi:MAG: hypothetical protein AMJ46_05160 [Latescibacteria bacterium DG_63]|nr:MAG: hypothetical protein AMJ46_05160 [Latescibacteria bacterium DG_63]
MVAYSIPGLASTGTASVSTTVATDSFGSPAVVSTGFSSLDTNFVTASSSSSGEKGLGMKSTAPRRPAVAKFSVLG